MATVTLTVPDALAALTVAMVKEQNPEAKDYTAKHCFALWVRKNLEPQLRQYAAQHVDSTALVAANTTADAAKAQADSALKTFYAAQKAAADTATTDVAGVS